jgi:hypothetical protein
MLLLQEEYERPHQASRVGLKVFEQPGGGFLVTEEWRGTTTMVKTLGLYDAREAALERARGRDKELQGQRYTKVPPAA